MMTHKYKQVLNDKFKLLLAMLAILLLALLAPDAIAALPTQIQGVTITGSSSLIDVIKQLFKISFPYAFWVMAVIFAYRILVAGFKKYSEISDNKGSYSEMFEVVAVGVVFIAIIFAVQIYVVQGLLV